MPTIHELEQTLHKEKMKEWEKREKLPNYRDDINELIDAHVPFSEDLKYHNPDYKAKVKNITEYKNEYILPLATIKALSFQEAQIRKAQYSILLGALSIYIAVILLMLVYLA